MQRDFPLDDPFNPTPSRLGEKSSIPYRPINEYDALLRAAPGDEPEESEAEVQAVREAVADCLDLISDQHRFILEAIHSERLSMRELGHRLGVGKSQAQRLVQQAQYALQEILQLHPIIRERITMYTTWNQAAEAAVGHLAPVGVPLTDDEALALIERKIEELRAAVNSGQTIELYTAASKLRTIGYGAAQLLDNLGAWSITDLTNLLIAKQNDYGHGNINAFGILGIIIRTSDKVARYINLVGKQALNESKIDTIVDLVGYAAIATMVEDGTFQLPLEVTV